MIVPAAVWDCGGFCTLPSLVVCRLTCQTFRGPASEPERPVVPSGEGRAAGSTDDASLPVPLGAGA